METSGDLQWGIAAVNLRASEAEQFSAADEDYQRHDGYFLKSYSADGTVDLRRVRSHVQFIDWSAARKDSEALVSLPSVKLVTVTVTESGYYTDPNGDLNLADPTIKAEVEGNSSVSVYAYLLAALATRVSSYGQPLTIACCDNIRQNGKMLRRNLLAYLQACQRSDLASWVENNVEFPCSMVDRITPRSPAALSEELTAIVGERVTSPVMAEDFTKWVLQSLAAGDMPDPTCPRPTPNSPILYGKKSKKWSQNGQSDASQRSQKLRQCASDALVLSRPRPTRPRLTDACGMPLKSFK